MPRRRHESTPERRATVKAMAAYGIPQEDIARVVGIEQTALRRYYRAELDTGGPQAVAKVAECLYQQAISGNTTAAIFFLKTRGKWRETERVELTGADGGPMKSETVAKVVILPPLKEPT